MIKAVKKKENIKKKDIKIKLIQEMYGYYDAIEEQKGWIKHYKNKIKRIENKLKELENK